MVFGVRVLSWFSFRKGGFALEGTTYSSLKGSEISHAVIPLMCPNGPLSFCCTPVFPPPTSACVHSFPLLWPSEPLILYSVSFCWYTLPLSCKPCCSFSCQKAEFVSWQNARTWQTCVISLSKCCQTFVKGLSQSWGHHSWLNQSISPDSWTDSYRSWWSCLLMFA